MRNYSTIGIVTLALTLGVTTFYALTPSRQAVDNRTKSSPLDSIRGQVVDALGRPVPKAKLHILRVGANPSGRVVFYDADAEGVFSIKGLAAGAYDIFVSKEEDDYPDTDLFFYSSKQSSAAQAVVAEQQPVPFVTVLIGPKAGRIIGRVVDAVTGAPIDDAKLTFRRPENKNMFLRTSLNQLNRKGGFDFLLPSAPLTIEATAPGYLPWSYRTPGSTKQLDLLTLEPGQTMEMVIKMRPVR